jgi:Fe-S cluster assembly ATP-binding protein
MLVIRNLHARSEKGEILRGLNLSLEKGEIHALMGPNGAGKSTLAKVLAGHPDYEVTEGELLFEGQNLLELEPEERAALGLFMSFQYPPEIAGITNAQFLEYALNALHQKRGIPRLSQEAFLKLLDEKMRLIEMRAEFRERHLNEGFSGGEKKRNEILQMAVLEPKCAILDETDSGLDIDALKIVAHGVNQLFCPHNALLVITHYQRLLNYIKPHFVHVLLEGRIVKSGDASLALQLEKQGYDWINGTGLL